jgi:hypothetical protein
MRDAAWRNHDSDVPIFGGFHTTVRVSTGSYTGTLLAAKRTHMRSLVVALLMAPLVGCVGVDRDIEDQITIDQGVYGLLVSGCKTSGCNAQPAANEAVVVYVPGADNVRVMSDGDGVYEIDLPAGDYTLCTSSCTPITVPAGIVRYDWTSGPEGGKWQGQQ